MVFVVGADDTAVDRRAWFPGTAATAAAVIFVFLKRFAVKKVKVECC